MLFFGGFLGFLKGQANRERIANLDIEIRFVSCYNGYVKQAGKQKKQKNLFYIYKRSDTTERLN